MTPDATAYAGLHTAFLTWHSGVLAVIEIPNGAGGRERLVVQLGNPDQAAKITGALADPSFGIVGPQGEIAFRVPQDAQSSSKLTRIELMRPLPASDGSVVWAPIASDHASGGWFMGVLLVVAIMLMTSMRIKNYPKPKGFLGKTGMVLKWFLFWNPGDFRLFKPEQDESTPKRNDGEVKP